jgi:putative PIN family toxin of toxin-antitoxin system
VTSKPRYVLDTNVIVSALLFPDSVPFQAFIQATKLGEILLSIETAEEIGSVLDRPKFNRYILAEERDRFLATLIRQATLVVPSERILECRDPKDNKFLEVAVGGKAEQLISGDGDLLSLKRFREVEIVSPAEFLESVK